MIRLENVTKTYQNSVVALRDASFDVPKGEFVFLVGPSGSGKSTLLRTLVGLLPPRKGRVALAGETLDYGSKPSLRRARDRFAIVFQQYNLFQNMSVLRNVTIAPVKIKGRPHAEVEADARRLLAKVGLADKHEAYPDELSGGQQQRVAIARALALKPEILLLDEVTSALDPELVGEVLDAVRGLAAEGMTMLIVSHEMGFVREVSSKVVMMDQGKVVEEGPPAQIFDDARTERARSFVGKILRH
jgi:polar amino acid transport system ATP-binding protein